MRPIEMTLSTAVLTAVLGITATAPAHADDPQQVQSPIQRGAYLVRLAGCNDCHTPWKVGPKGPEPDMTRMLSGHPEGLAMPPAPELGKGPWVWAGSGSFTAFAGPWGVSFAANLTPDPETGLGRWTEEMFKNAVRTGRHQGNGRPILPPMPAANVAQASDEDLSAIFAYLHSLKPIRNRVPQPIDPPESGQR